MRPERQRPSGWLLINRKQLHIIIGKCDLVLLKKEYWFLEIFLRIQLREGPENSNPIGRVPMWCQEPMKMGHIICKL